MSPASLKLTAHRFAMSIIKIKIEEIIRFSCASDVIFDRYRTEIKSKWYYKGSTLVVLVLQGFNSIE